MTDFNEVIKLGSEHVKKLKDILYFAEENKLNVKFLSHNVISINSGCLKGDFLLYLLNSFDIEYIRVDEYSEINIGLEFKL